jgi:PAS domain S-box-containing protein
MIKNELLSVLSLEDSIVDFEIICNQLTAAGYNLRITRVDGGDEYVSLLLCNKYDIILADFSLPGFDAFGALKLRNEICPDTPFICVSGSIGEETAIELLKLGAVDYVLKDRSERLPFAIERAIDEAKREKSRQLAENELHFSEEIFRHFMEHSPIYVFFKDENVRAIRLSKNFETMMGLPLKELLGKNMFDLFPSELAKSMVEDDMKVLKAGEVLQIEEEYNGRLFTTIKFPINIENKPTFLAGYTIDITERKAAEKALFEKVSEMERFQRLVVGRELKMIELKKEINELLARLGEDARYNIAE